MIFLGGSFFILGAIHLMFLIGTVMGTDSLTTLFKFHRLERMEIFGVKPKLEDLKPILSEYFKNKAHLISALGAQNAKKQTEMGQKSSARLEDKNIMPSIN